MKAAAAWPLAIVGVLGVTVIANVGLWWQANGPAGRDIEPDYYRRALAWDSTQAARTRSAALGWRVQAGFAAVSSGLELEVALADSLGAAVSGAAVHVAGVHNLDPLEPQLWRLEESAPGHYSAGVRLPHHGRWELRVWARRGTGEFMTVLHAEAPKAQQAPPEPRQP